MTHSLLFGLGFYKFRGLGIGEKCTKWYRRKAGDGRCIQGGIMNMLSMRWWFESWKYPSLSSGEKWGLKIPAGASHLESWSLGGRKDINSRSIFLKFTPSLMSASTDAISSEITFSVLDGNLYIYCLSFSLECKEGKGILFVMFTSVSPLCITTQAYSGHLINIHSTKKWKILLEFKWKYFKL